LPVMRLGCDGAAVTIVTACILEVPFPQLLPGVTVISPEVFPAITVMLLVPFPEVMFQPEGTVHAKLTPTTFVTL
jgi:hypothetical protein